MALRELLPGVWELKVYVGLDPVTGHKRWRSRRFKGSERSARKALALFTAEIESSGDRLRSVITLDVLIGKWMDRQRREGRAPTYLATCQGYIDRLIVPRLGRRPITALTAGELRDLYAEMTSTGRSPSAVRQVRAVISGALQLGLEHEWVDRNVARVAKPPALDQEPLRSPEPDEVRALLEAAEARPDQFRLAAAVGLAALTGARLGELCALRWSDLVMLESGPALSIQRSAHKLTGEDVALGPLKTRGKGKRVVALDELGSALLARRRAEQEADAEAVASPLVDDPYILSSRSDGDGPPSPHAVTNAFGRLRDSLELPHVHMHSLRHSATTELLGQGVDVRTISGRLGHSSPSVMLRTYTHELPELDRAAAEVIGRRVRGLPAAT